MYIRKKKNKEKVRLKKTEENTLFCVLKVDGNTM